MVVDVAGATWTAPATAVVGAGVIDVVVVVVVGCVFLRSITVMIISINWGSMASIVARTISANCDVDIEGEDDGGDERNHWFCCGC